MHTDEIKEKLSDRNLAEVARRLGLSRAYLSAIMTGRREPSEQVKQSLESYLKAH